MFRLLESPRYLIGLGKDAEAVAVIHQLAKYNSTGCDITVEELTLAFQKTEQAGGHSHHILSQSSNFGFKHIKALFATPRMAWSTSLLITLWGS
jgi:hypothetical protein